MEKIVIGPPDAWSVGYWLAALNQSGMLYWVAGVLVVLFLIICIILRTPRS